nr:myosin-G heavy chain isoform X2 [Drosophila takahashii]
MAQTMDDMVFQCSNQNSIYVLNASYGAYGDYGTYAATKREINGSRSRAANPIEATCSSGVLQHKFKTFGSAAAAAAATTATTMAMDAAAAGSASNYVNPVATSMSTAMCSPATAALQKLFNCSVGVACQNVTHAHSNHSSSSNISSSNTNSSNTNSSNNNAAASNHNNRCLSAAGGVTQNGRNRSRSGESLDGTAGVATSTGGGAGGNLPLMPKKKCTNVKSALIAKKTKFLKYLEEEKWRSTAAVPEDAAGAISNEAGQPPPPNFGGNNNGGNLKNQSNSREAGNGGTGGAGGTGGQLNKLTNWSMHNEDNNTATTTATALTSQQLQLQQQAKSSYELYQEAADILGLSCSLCDNCRCLDCQSGYFDCDDDDESYSEQSLMDDEYDEFDCSAEELQAVLTGGGGGVVPVPPCCQLDASSHLPPKGDSPALTNVESLGHRLAIDFDLINATCSQVLENCETFNDLSLLDAGGSAGSGVEQRPFT